MAAKYFSGCNTPRPRPATAYSLYRKNKKSPLYYIPFYLTPPRIVSGISLRNIFFCWLWENQRPWATAPLKTPRNGALYEYAYDYDYDKQTTVNRYRLMTGFNLSTHSMLQSDGQMQRYSICRTMHVSRAAKKRWAYRLRAQWSATSSSIPMKTPSTTPRKTATATPGEYNALFSSSVITS